MSYQRGGTQKEAAEGAEPAEVPEVQHMIAVCSTCGTPVRVTLSSDEIMRVLAPCGHVVNPAAPDSPDP